MSPDSFSLKIEQKFNEEVYIFFERIRIQRETTFPLEGRMNTNTRLAGTAHYLLRRLFLDKAVLIL